MKKKLYLFVILTCLLVGFNFSCTKNSCTDPDKENCVCPAVVEPVCGSDNKTYSNSCEAECNGIEKYKTGECN